MYSGLQGSGGLTICINYHVLKIHCFLNYLIFIPNYTIISFSPELKFSVSTFLLLSENLQNNKILLEKLFYYFILSKHKFID